MYRTLLILILAFYMQSCRNTSFLTKNIVFKDGIATVYLIKNKMYFDGMALCLKIGNRYFEGVEGKEPFYKKTSRGYLFFTYSLEPSIKHRILTINFYDPKTEINSQYGPFKIQYYFSPESDRIVLENNLLVIYPALLHFV